MIHGIALAGVGLLSLIALPRVQDYPRRNHPSRVRGWLLAFAGFPTLPFALMSPWVVASRDPGRSTAHTVAFRRATILITAIYGVIATITAIATIAIIHLNTDVSMTAVLLLAGACVATTAPWSAILATRSQAIFAPFRSRVPTKTRGEDPPSLAQRFGLPTAAILIGMVCPPILGATAYVHEAGLANATLRARADAVTAHALLQRRSESELGSFLANHRNVAVSMHGRRYGAINLFEDSQPHEREILRVGDPKRRVLVAIEPPEFSTGLLALVTMLLGVGIGLFSAIRVMQALHTDLGLATAQIRKVVEGGRLEKNSQAQFMSPEISELVHTLKGLVVRITETNIARYVAIERAHEAGRLRSEFLANMSHDLRSPLNSILGFSELLLSGIEGPLSDDNKELVKTIHDNGRALLQQIDDILDTAKIDSGKLDLHPEPTPPATLLSRATRRAKARFVRPVDIIANLVPGLPPVYIDPFRTVQAIENVLVFAAEPLLEGTLVVDVGQHIDHDEMRYVVVKVRSPMPAPTSAELNEFQRGFSRLPGHSGLGLSLPIAGAIFELGMGSLEIGEEKNMTVFSIFLPSPKRRKPLRLDTAQNAP
jgi:signal transduction histidine kinase